MSRGIRRVRRIRKRPAHGGAAGRGGVALEPGRELPRRGSATPRAGRQPGRARSGPDRSNGPGPAAACHPCGGILRPRPRRVPGDAETRSDELRGAEPVRPCVLGVAPCRGEHASAGRPRTGARADGGVERPEGDRGRSRPRVPARKATPTGSSGSAVRSGRDDHPGNPADPARGTSSGMTASALRVDSVPRHLRPAATTAYASLGAVLVAQMRPHEAIEELESVQRHVPEHPSFDPVRWMLAQAHLCAASQAFRAMRTESRPSPDDGAARPDGGDPRRDAIDYHREKARPPLEIIRAHERSRESPAFARLTDISRSDRMCRADWLSAAMERGQYRVRYALRAGREREPSQALPVARRQDAAAGGLDGRRKNLSSSTSGAEAWTSACRSMGSSETRSSAVTDCSARIRFRSLGHASLPPTTSLSSRTGRNGRCRCPSRSRMRARRIVDGRRRLPRVPYRSSGPPPPPLEVPCMRSRKRAARTS